MVAGLIGALAPSAAGRASASPEGAAAQAMQNIHSIGKTAAKVKREVKP
ncbi:MAG TPA: hypothetical protein PLS25_02485 [Methanoregulaceae archaeon]|nr:hypothetical protein [Methanoregulaceae archaeon]